MVTNRHGDSVDITLRSCETAAQRYADQSTEPSLALCAFLNLLADAVGFGRVLGSAAVQAWTRRTSKSAG